MSNSKCAYCEVNIAEESKYMEVDHFKPKGVYPTLVVEWGNLLPSCKRCNIQKGTHDVITHGMIIDPTLNQPNSHLRLRDFRLRGKDPVGTQTIETLYLNDSERIVRKRFDVGEAIAMTLEKLRLTTEDYIVDPASVRRRNQIVRGIKELLLETYPSKEFSATAATVILANEDYVWIRERLDHAQLWDQELLAAQAIAASAQLA